jgi:hypothetical protein
MLIDCPDKTKNKKGKQLPIPKSHSIEWLFFMSFYWLFAEKIISVEKINK